MKLSLSLNKQSETPLRRQLYEELRRLVLNGELKPGMRFPSERELAEDLRISRPTVAACLEQLEAEGYLETKPGSGSYVRDLPSFESHQSPPDPSMPLSGYGRQVSELEDRPFHSREPEIAFFCWRPALDQFPNPEWARIVARHARQASLSTLDYQADPQGSLDLREAIAGLVGRFRDVKCDAGQIVLVHGLNHGLDLFARLHLERNCPAFIEEPGYPAAWSIFQSYGASAVAVPVDAHGLVVDALPSQPGAVCYATPAHHFPTGVIMPLSRRLELLRWAAANGAIILEDDYDSEYKSQGMPIPALMSLDADQSVVYLGTLNQLMYPALAVAYLILPPKMVPLYRRARPLTGEHMPLQLQEAIAEFINEGHLDRHIRRLRTIYSQRRQALVKALNRYLRGMVEIGPATGGVFVPVKIKCGLTGGEIVERARELGVGLMMSAAFYRGAAPDNEFIFGYGSLDSSEIEEGIKRLASIVRSAGQGSV